MVIISRHDVYVVFVVVFPRILGMWIVSASMFPGCEVSDLFVHVWGL